MKRITPNQVGLLAVGAIAAVVGAQMIAGFAPPARANCDTLSPQALPQVVVYGASWCGTCKKTKWLLEDLSVAYCEYDIEKSATGAARFSDLGGVGVPLIMVGNQRLQGLDKKTLTGVLRQQGLVEL